MSIRTVYKKKIQCNEMRNGSILHLAAGRDGKQVFLNFFSKIAAVTCTRYINDITGSRSTEKQRNLRPNNQ